MAIQVTPQNKSEIQARTVVYNPIYVNNMKPEHTSGSYVLFYIFTKTSVPLQIPTSSTTCTVEALDKLGKKYEHTFVKIGNFASGSKSRWSSNKGDLIKNDGNRSPAARHSQDVLINYADLYCHFIMVVLSPDTVERHLEEALTGIVSAIHNKQEKVLIPPGKWQTPIQLKSSEKISAKLASKINSKIAK